jgi:hypothetical protein
MSSIEIEIVRDLAARKFVIEAFIEQLLDEINTLVLAGKGKGLPSAGLLSPGLTSLVQTCADDGYWVALFLCEDRVVGLMLDFFNFGDFVQVPFWILPSADVDDEFARSAATQLAANHCAEIIDLIAGNQRVVYGRNLNVCDADARLFFPLTQARTEIASVPPALTWSELICAWFKWWLAGFAIR